MIHFCKFLLISFSVFILFDRLAAISLDEVFNGLVSLILLLLSLREGWLFLLGLLLLLDGLFWDEMV